ncbi:Carbon monoxide dehydrogenase subunit G [Rhizobiales bacterium GAS191]|jgi:carbon monoxide dehydrogenase subunit G|nr:Carbon monoxide dehydrogenase subunit G [Rhizobiales bacterium GAS113]SEE45697.1 Carbon monoxide dehydrogenase subunit G [Rhizobiales bacterium GAS191]
MASNREEILTTASPEQVWDAIRDIGALHTRLVPGFVVDTRLEPGARIVTFGNGVVAKEPIVTIDEAARRLVWSAEGARTTHYNASAQVFPEGEGRAKVVWIADFLPDAVATDIRAAMQLGAKVMKQTLDRLADQN